MATLSGVPCDIFQRARDRVGRDITDIVQRLNNKQTEMFEKITCLEKEFKNKQQQKQKELNKLHSMKARTEEELRENSLAETQQNIIRNLQQGITKLSQEIESCREPNYRIEVEWGMCLTTLHYNIADSQIQVVRLIAPTGPILLPHRESMRLTQVEVSEDNWDSYGGDWEENPFIDDGSNDWEENPFIDDGATDWEENPFIDDGATDWEENPLVDEGATDWEENPFIDDGATDWNYNPWD